MVNERSKGREVLLKERLEASCANCRRDGNISEHSPPSHSSCSNPATCCTGLVTAQSQHIEIWWGCVHLVHNVGFALMWFCMYVQVNVFCACEGSVGARAFACTCVGVWRCVVFILCLLFSLRFCNCRDVTSRTEELQRSRKPNAWVTRIRIYTLSEQW